MPRMATVIIMPGNVGYPPVGGQQHTPVAKHAAQEISGAWMPTPRKLRDASVMMLPATLMVDTTIKEGHTLGRI